MENASETPNPKKPFYRQWWTEIIGHINREIDAFESKDKKEKTTKSPDEIVANATKWIMRLTAVLAVVGILTLCVLRNRLEEMHSGGVDTHKLASAAVDQAQWEQMLFYVADVIFAKTPQPANGETPAGASNDKYAYTGPFSVCPNDPN